MLNKIYYFLRKPREINQKKYLLISGIVALTAVVFINWSSFLNYHRFFFSKDNFFIFKNGKLDLLMLWNHLMMTYLLLRRPNLKIDLLTAVVGFVGGLCIEFWGTQSQLWVYFTLERPPMWIIPSWIVLTIAIDRFYEILNNFFKRRHLISEKWWAYLYWISFLIYSYFMVNFVRDTITQSLTIFSIIAIVFNMVLLPIFKPLYRECFLIFIAGSLIGYFIELWGTTRHIWTYYNHQTPPFVVVFGHGLVAVVFWRTRRISEFCLQRYRDFLNRILPLDPSLETKSLEKN